MWRNRNRFLSPHDPSYDDDYEPQEDYEAYLDECEIRYELEREYDFN